MKQEEKITAFWEWFRQEMDKPRLKLTYDSERYLRLVQETVNLDRGLVVDVSQFPGKTKELIVSSNGVRDKFSLVMQVVDEAPKLKYWKVVAFKQAQTAHININVDGLYAETSDMFYELVEEKPEECKLNVWFIVADDLDERHKRVAEVTVANKVGEYVAATRIEIVGVYRVDQMKDYKGKLLPMVEILMDERVMGSGGN